jgi:DNA polymerase III epsilon subunit-like protein
MSLAMLSLADRRHEMTDFKLVTVAAHLGVGLDQAHNALADARATKAIFEKVR